MKIMHFIYSLNIGGGSLHVEKLLSDLGDKFDCVVVGGVGTSANNMKSQFPGKVFFYNIFLLPFMLVFWFFKWNPDVIHLHGRMAGAIGRILFFLFNVKIVYTIHGFSFESDSKFKRLAFIFLEKALASRSNYIVFVSKEEKDLYSSVISNKYESNFRLVYNYVEVDKYINVIRTNDLKKSPLHAIYIGRMSYQKGVDILLQAISMTDQKLVDYTLIGEGPLLEEYKKLSKVLNLNNVKFLGAIPSASRLLHHYDFLIIPSRFEGMPYIMIEGVSSCIPIVCTPARGVREFLSQDNSFISENISATSLAVQLNIFLHAALNEERDVFRRVENAKRLISDQFSKDIQIKKLEELYLI